MAKLKLGPIADDRPVKLTIEIPARLHCHLVTYGTVLNGGEELGAPTPEQLIAPMLERFMATDRAFAKARRNIQPAPVSG